jgi:NAD-dependent DNA ligase
MAAYHIFTSEEIRTTTDVSLLNDTVAILDQRYWSEQPTDPYTDVEFDALVVRLRELDPDAPALKTLGGMGAGESVEDAAPAGKIRHKRPMLSLEKAYTDAEIAGWMARNGVTDVIVTPKIDGMALSIRYDDNGDLAHQLWWDATVADGRARLQAHMQEAVNQLRRGHEA